MSEELEIFLVPADNSNPSGVELRNDARFHALERQLEPAAIANRSGADSADPDAAAIVDWEEVIEKSRDLAKDGQDLRLLVIVVRALYNLDGFGGLAAGLGMLSGVIDEFWDTVHPGLRERDNPRDAAVRRINAVLQLQNDENGLLGDLQINPVFTIRGLGPVTGRDLARGLLNADQVLRESASGLGQEEQAKIAEAQDALRSRVGAACRAYTAEQEAEMAALKEAVAQSVTALATLEGTMSGKIGGDGAGVSLGELSRFLERVAATLNATADAPAKDAAKTQKTEGGDMTDDTPTTPAKAAEPAAINGTPAPVGAIASRDDVMRHLDLIIEFYERTEPSSPIPHLAKRIRRMVPMDFMELMEEIAPSGMKEFNSAAGVAAEKTK
ncbi:type VI secretion system protein TssA [Aliiroseovarius sp. YM-037]|uniref:type VI secretion system protein TssA n=1 Tax=Aliiroseovarius sp. YM-037 TaxID=3341728 RepID=UPI003A811D7D